MHKHSCCLQWKLNGAVVLSAALFFARCCAEPRCQWSTSGDLSLFSLLLPCSFKISSPDLEVTAVLLYCFARSKLVYFDVASVTQKLEIRWPLKCVVPGWWKWEEKPARHGWMTPWSSRRAAAEMEKVFIRCCPWIPFGMWCFVAVFAEVLDREESAPRADGRLCPSASCCPQFSWAGCTRILHPLPGEGEQLYRCGRRWPSTAPEQLLRLIYMGVTRVSHVLPLRCVPSPPASQALPSWAVRLS